MSEETISAIVIAVITLLGSGTIGGAFLAWVLRNRRLEKAQTDKEIVSVDAARLTTILESSGDLEEIATRIADSTFERSEKEIARVEARYERDVSRLEKRIAKLESSQLATEKENAELRQQIRDVVKENLVLRQQIEELVMRERKSTVIRQINYYAMLVSKVSPPLDPASFSKASLADLERKAAEFKEKAKDQSNFQDYQSLL